MDFNILARFLMKECNLQANGLILVGVSGGSDSLCLLLGLKNLGCSVAAAHFDHQLRPDAEADAAFVKMTANQMNIPFILGTADVRQLAAQERTSIEETARNARYRFLFEQARLLKAQAVAVGHTADDQVETVLMHLLRGAGLSGLKGMAPSGIFPEWDPAIPLIRPLLSIWKSETEAYCEQNGLKAHTDPSNTDVTFFRNRLRHELIPLLQSYNPKIKEGLLRTARTLASDHELLTGQVEAAWQTAQGETIPGEIRLSLAAMREFHPALQRSLLRFSLAKLRPYLRDIDFEAVERGLEFIRKPPATNKVDWVSRVWLMVSGDRLVLSDRDVDPKDPRQPALEADAEYTVAVPGRVEFGQGWVITTARREYDPDFLNVGSDNPFCALLNGDPLDQPLSIRSRKPGDRFEPLGMDGHSMKLADFFINERLSQAARPFWPLLLCGQKIAWVPGFRPAHFCRLTVETRQVIEVRLFRNEPARD